MLPPFVQIIGGRPQLDAGALRHSITVQRETPSGAYDAAGPAISTATVITALAAISSPGGNDSTKGGQTVTEVDKQIALWYQPGVLPSMFVVHGTKRYRIVSLENVLEMNLVLVLNCAAIGANA